MRDSVRFQACFRDLHCTCNYTGLPPTATENHIYTRDLITHLTPYTHTVSRGISRILVVALCLTGQVTSAK